MRTKAAIAELMLGTVLASAGVAQTTQGNQSPAINTGGNVQITYEGMTPEQTKAFLLTHFPQPVFASGPAHT